MHLPSKGCVLIVDAPHAPIAPRDHSLRLHDPLVARVVVLGHDQPALAVPVAGWGRTGPPWRPRGRRSRHRRPASPLAVSTATVISSAHSGRIIQARGENLKGLFIEDSAMSAGAERVEAIVWWISRKEGSGFRLSQSILTPFGNLPFFEHHVHRCEGLWPIRRSESQEIHQDSRCGRSGDPGAAAFPPWQFKRGSGRPIGGRNGVEKGWEHLEKPLAPRSGPRGATLFKVMPARDTGIVTENRYSDPEMWARRYSEFETGAIGTGIAIGDYDGDGRPDIFVVSKAESCRLFRNLGTGNSRT